MINKRVVTIAAVLLLLAAGVGRASAQTSTPTQSEFDHALQVIQATGSAYFNTTTTTAPATTTTEAATTTTTTTATTVASTTTTATTTAPPPPSTPAATQAVVALHPGTSWDWQIAASAPVLTTLDKATGAQKMLDVDMENTSAAQVAAIKAKEHRSCLLHRDR
jgi:hypothetical protein